MTEEIKIYKPTLVKEEPLPLEKQELSYAQKLPCEIERCLLLA